MFESAALDRLLEDLGEADSGADAARSRDERRRAGAFFTPRALVEFVVERAVAALGDIEWRADGTPALRILDPAAGDGRFLAAAARHLAALSPRSDLPRTELAAAVARRCAVAIERDPDFAAAARRALPGAEVRCLEALCDGGELGPFDLVVSNPPYLRSIHLGDSDEALRRRLRGRYQATSFGEWDLYAAFIEQSLRWLGRGGVAGLVVPSRWLTARYARGLRAELARHRAALGVVDFDTRQIFADATTYSSLLFLGEGGAERLAVARLESGRWSLGQIEAASLGAAPWRLAVGAERRRIAAMERAGPRLGELARVAKGTGTNADRVYVFEGPAPDLETELLRPCLRGRDVRPWGAADRVRCLVPYRADGRLIEPDELAARYPRARAYLESRRPVLEARERGRFRGERFYQFGRPQNLALHLGGALKVVVPDIARTSRALVDRGGALVLDSAYAIVPRRPEDAPLIAAVFNSPAPMLWLRATGIGLRGGYRRMKTAYLEGMPLPDPDGDAARAIRAAVAAGEPPEALSETVRLAYGIAAGAWR